MKKNGQELLTIRGLPVQTANEHFTTKDMLAIYIAGCSKSRLIFVLIACARRPVRSFSLLPTTCLVLCNSHQQDREAQSHQKLTLWYPWISVSLALSMMASGLPRFWLLNLDLAEDSTRSSENCPCPLRN